jgi:LysR family transcriptional regulator, hydrogen peroxide-inducible genes activator
VPTPNDLSLRQLQYVVAVADSLGFHKAAAQCHVSQPTLSAQVALLESVLGVRLFERDRRRVLVTPTGEAVVARARRVLLEVDDLIATATRAQSPFAGTLRIGVIPTMAPYVLPEVTPAITKKYPGISLVFQEEKTADIVRGLAEGALDAGIAALEAELGDTAHAELARDDFVVALPKHHPLAKKKQVSLDELEDERVLLLDEGHCFRSQALALCGKAHADVASFRATSLATLAQMVSSGAGITLLPALSVAVENRRGQLEIRPFTKPAPRRTVVLVWRKSSPFGAAFEELGAVLKQALAQRQ